ncbi:glycosyltransferase family 4 protein [Avrilella dinanensis]|uniref:Glycosyltransferase family 1 protein n=1 Tax=Avrilella dinanensis TaxID=2008672 RepID=A0A2M9R4U7_9FLAO|nr:glycosyltransferase family 4 protein [Avrilella dinanensis]PJR03862.1 glycosyltransferase family 1 protein [Avrilella dinanensis]
MKTKLIRITTVPQSLRGLLKGQLNYMSTNGFEVIGVSSPGEALHDVERNEGVKTVGIEMTRSITPIQDLKALVQLIQLFRKEKPHIVHTHTPKAGLLGMMAAKIAGVPHRLHTVAGMPLTVATGSKRQLLNQMEKLTYACATKVYPNSFGLEKIILDEKFTSPSKLKVIGNGSSNGIDTSIFDPALVKDEVKSNLRKELNINNNDTVLLYVGRIVKDKGINELVTAFNNIIDDSLKLILVGGVHKNDPISKTSKEIIETNNRIKAVGIKRNVIDYYAIADVFVFPSYREGFPNVLLEACSMGLPCVVTNINGNNEIIQDGINGLIVEPRDANGLEIAIRNIINSSINSDNIKQQNREIIRENYERKKLWENILDEYKNLKNA